MQLFDNIDDISSILEDDGIIIHPTDTIWGLACSSSSQKAIERIYQIKDRPLDQKFLLLVDSIEMLKEYVQLLHPRIETLLMHYNQALTLIHPNPNNLLDILISKEQTVAIRVTHHSYTKKIISTLGVPLVSTSANFRGEAFPQNFKDLDEKLLSMVDYVAKEGRNTLNENLPSIIASYNEEGELDFIRE